MSFYSLDFCGRRFELLHIQLMYCNISLMLSDKQFGSIFPEIAVPSPLPLPLGCFRSPDNSEGNVSPCLVNDNIFLMIINTELTFPNFFSGLI